jgi:dephospho-CoA kinase
MIIIGITGTLGAGKGEIVSILKIKNFTHYSVRDFLTQELKRRNTEVNRDTMTLLANELRKIHSPRYIIEQLYNQAVAKGEDAVIESVRTPGEIDFLKSQKKGTFYLLAVDADQKIRYERIVGRKSDLDKVSFEKFVSDEQREMISSDPTKQSISECMRRADVVIRNDGNLDDLAHQVEQFLHQKNKSL